jgi:putative heme-binding domain-containing protein
MMHRFCSVHFLPSVFLAALMPAAVPMAAEDASATAKLRASYRDYGLAHPGDAQAGEKLFRDHANLACANCHAVTGEEKSGPNLDGIADKYGREDLIRHILEPSAFIQPGYEQVSIVTTDGKIITGRIRLVTKLIYRLWDAQGKRIDVSKSDIEEIHAATKSMMPDDVATAISPDEFADLIAFLSTLRSGVLTGFAGPEEPVEIHKLPQPVILKPVHPPELKFTNPVWCGAIPGAAGQLAVVEHQEAKIWRLNLNTQPPEKHLFADLGDVVSVGANQGLMCLAFHPDYELNGRYFLKYEVREQGGVKTTVAGRLAGADRLSDCGAASSRLLDIEQPAFNHNGGCIAFGPDGMLYAAFGDGGPQRDPPGHSQNPRIFHGSMLRIDVDRQEDGRPYAIPADNPFLTRHREDAEIRPETWAIGFREPWRFTFDALNGDLWLGDVGQDKYEEVAIVRRGENHGWNVMEAFVPFSSQYRRDAATYVAPVFAYPHGIGVSVTGGCVYRGDPASSFYGVYVFADYESRRVWGLRQENRRLSLIRELAKSPEHIVAFGVDDAGELLAVGYEGTVFRLDFCATQFR